MKRGHLAYKTPYETEYSASSEKANSGKLCNLSPFTVTYSEDRHFLVSSFSWCVCVHVICCLLSSFSKVQQIKEPSEDFFVLCKHVCINFS
ncbi:hypothetical protein X975_01790, partial [Stegodyphus mimosarum]